MAPQPLVPVMEASWCHIVHNYGGMVAGDWSYPEVCGDEVASGWPLGLDNMNLRLRNVETLRAVPAASNSLRLHSTSFSSFSSSDLDTESTRSFFQDRSISLGRLIGIKPGEGDLYFPTTFHFVEQDRVSILNADPNTTQTCEMTMCHGVCIPVISDVLEKMSQGRHTWRRRC